MLQRRTLNVGKNPKDRSPVEQANKDYKYPPRSSPTQLNQIWPNHDAPTHQGSAQDQSIYGCLIWFLHSRRDEKDSSKAQNKIFVLVLTREF